MTLDTWYTVQTGRRRALRRGYRMVSYNDPPNPNTNNPPNTIINGHQLWLDDYAGYYNDAQCWVNAPGPINEEETWRFVSGNVNRLKPYGDLKEIITIVNKLRHLQAGGILLNETNV
jgi:hypothetical protein